MLDDIEKMLRATADKLRANIDAVEYKQVASGLILLQGWGPGQQDRDQSRPGTSSKMISAGSRLVLKVQPDPCFGEFLRALNVHSAVPARERGS